MKKNSNIKNVTEINGCKVFIENGEVKTVLSEEIEKAGYMTLDEACQLGMAQIRKIYEMKDALHEE